MWSGGVTAPLCASTSRPTWTDRVSNFTLTPMMAARGATCREVYGRLANRTATVAGDPRMNLELANKLALVSGSTAGIGFAIAELLLREGARVIINGRTQQGVDAALAKLSAYSNTASGFAGDLSQA